MGFVCLAYESNPVCMCVCVYVALCLNLCAGGVVALCCRVSG